MSTNPSASSGFLSKIGPKHMVSTLITMILVFGELNFGIVGGFDRMVAALGTCMVVEAVLSKAVIGRTVPLLSAYISGNSMVILLKPQDVLWPFALGAAMAISSKYVLRWRGRHLWNPTNLAICVLLLIAPSVSAILSHEWGNAWTTNAIVWVVGLIVVQRAKVLHISIAYVLAFLGLAGLRAWQLDLPYLTEAAPLTGPMYQLLVFFMITDPATTVATRRGRIGVAVGIAALEHVLRLGADSQAAWATPFQTAPALFALFFLGPIAKIVSLELQAKAADPGSLTGKLAA